MLVDIAGLDTPAGALDHDVQQAARRAVAGADVILHIDDGRETADNPAPLPEHAAPTLNVRTKIDQSPAPAGQIGVSAVSGAGMDELRAALADVLGERGVSVTGEKLALQPRHEAALRSAAASVAAARERLESQRDAHALTNAEVIAGALRDALDDLAGLGGEMTPDDVIGKIFATFCVGK
jgi:tRNA modification GTPase